MLTSNLPPGMPLSPFSKLLAVFARSATRRVSILNTGISWSAFNSSMYIFKGGLQCGNCELINPQGPCKRIFLMASTTSFFPMIMPA